MVTHSEIKINVVIIGLSLSQSLKLDAEKSENVSSNSQVVVVLLEQLSKRIVDKPTISFIFVVFHNGNRNTNEYRCTLSTMRILWKGERHYAMQSL